MKRRKVVAPPSAPAPDPAGVLTVFEVADRLRLKPPAVRSLACRGLIAHYRLGRALRFRSGDVEAFLADCYRPPRGRARPSTV
jgi:excisionase family DNA binding protein